MMGLHLAVEMLALCQTSPTVSQLPGLSDLFLLAPIVGCHLGLSCGGSGCFLIPKLAYIPFTQSGLGLVIS